MKAPRLALPKRAGSSGRDCISPPSVQMPPPGADTWLGHFEGTEHNLNHDVKMVERPQKGSATIAPVFLFGMYNILTFSPVFF